MKKEITIYDIARELKISAATVSRGLRKNGEVNKKTVKVILKKAKDMGYRPNKFATSLRKKSTNTLGVIVPKLLNSHFIASVLAGMECVASERKYNLIIAQSLEKYENERENAMTMFSSRVDGLLLSLAADTKSLDHLAPFLQRKIPVLLFDRGENSESVSLVTIDNFKAAHDVTKHLISQGCKKILHLAGNPTRDSYANRIKGYQEALKENHISVQEELIWVSSLDENAGIEAAKKILKMPASERPDAVFAANDISAVYCMLHLKENGIRIPADICFAGFNNDPVCLIVEPKLTSVNYSGFETGKTAAANLIDLINYPDTANQAKTVILHSKLIVRDSSKRK
jgi:LacI family transcriptional regulator